MPVDQTGLHGPFPFWQVSLSSSPENRLLSLDEPRDAMVRGGRTVGVTRVLGTKPLAVDYHVRRRLDERVGLGNLVRAAYTRFPLKKENEKGKDTHEGS